MVGCHKLRSTRPTASGSSGSSNCRATGISTPVPSIPPNKPGARSSASPPTPSPTSTRAWQSIPAITSRWSGKASADTTAVSSSKLSTAGNGRRKSVSPITPPTTGSPPSRSTPPAQPGSPTTATSTATTTSSSAASPTSPAPKSQSRSARISKPEPQSRSTPPIVSGSPGKTARRTGARIRAMCSPATPEALR